MVVILQRVVVVIHWQVSWRIVLDMRKRNKVQQKLVHVQDGAIWKDVNHAAYEHGLAVVGTTVEYVGVSGSTLCGGIGLLTGRHDLVPFSFI